MKLHILLDIIQLIFPKTCFSCKDVLLSRERILCLKCYLNLPKHIGKKKKHQFNLYVNGQNYKIYCRYKYQKKSAVQKMIYSLKYKNKPHIGYYLGAELYKTISHLQDVSYIIPVPLHKRKEKIRGYNQSQILAKGMKPNIKCEVLSNILLRKEDKESQTRKSRYHRFENIEGVFFITSKKLLENKHIILIDDVFTTGATISECIKALQEINNIRISIVCLAA